MFKYFTYAEFDSPDEIGSGNRMKDSFVDKLDAARDIAGISFKITSGYRTIEHNAKVGGKIDSSHLKGIAADIKAETSRERFIIIDALLSVGFCRLGIDFKRGFIHVDDDIDKHPDLIWGY